VGVNSAVIYGKNICKCTVVIRFLKIGIHVV
jgi:hypothetical protein